MLYARLYGMSGKVAYGRIPGEFTETSDMLIEVVGMSMTKSMEFSNLGIHPFAFSISCSIVGPHRMILQAMYVDQDFTPFTYLDEPPIANKYRQDPIKFEFVRKYDYDDYVRLKAEDFYRAFTRE